MRARVEDELDQVLGGRAARYEDLERLPYTLAVVKETMRLHPPAYLLRRRAREDVEIGGYQLPAGRVVRRHGAIADGHVSLDELAQRAPWDYGP